MGHLAFILVVVVLARGDLDRVEEPAEIDETHSDREEQRTGHQPQDRRRKTGAWVQLTVPVGVLVRIQLAVPISILAAGKRNGIEQDSRDPAVEGPEGIVDLGLDLAKTAQLGIRSWLRLACHRVNRLGRSQE